MLNSYAMQWKHWASESDPFRGRIVTLNQQSPSLFRLIGIQLPPAESERGERGKIPKTNQSCFACANSSLAAIQSRDTIRYCVFPIINTLNTSIVRRRMERKYFPKMLNHYNALQSHRNRRPAFVCSFARLSRAAAFTFEPRKVNPSCIHINAMLFAKTEFK